MLATSRRVLPCPYLGFVLRSDGSGWELCRALIGGRLLPCNRPPGPPNVQTAMPRRLFRADHGQLSLVGGEAHGWAPRPERNYRINASVSLMRPAPSPLSGVATPLEGLVPAANGLWPAILAASPVGKSCEALGFPRDPLVVFYNSAARLFLGSSWAWGNAYQPCLGRFASRPAYPLTVVSAVDREIEVLQLREPRIFGAESTYLTFVDGISTYKTLEVAIGVLVDWISPRCKKFCATKGTVVSFLVFVKVCTTIF